LRQRQSEIDARPEHPVPTEPAESSPAAPICAWRQIGVAETCAVAQSESRPSDRLWLLPWHLPPLS